MITKRLLQVISISLFFVANAVFYAGNVLGADTDFSKFWIITEGAKQNYFGEGKDTGDNNRSGWKWRQDDSGYGQGPGGNNRSGWEWRQNNSGNLQGTGDNYGSGETQDYSGNGQGTGDNFGSGGMQK